MTETASIPRPGETTIGGLLAARAREMPEALFAAFPDCEVTYGEMDAQARAVARGLIALGVTPGAHVALLMPNCPQWLQAYFGALYAGAAVVPLNARYKRHELAYTIEHSDAQVLLTTAAFAEFVDFAQLITATLPDLESQSDPIRLRLAGAPKLKSVVMFGKAPPNAFLSSEQLRELGSAIPDAAIEVARGKAVPDDVVALMYTSGTTSNPKACALTHVGIQRSWYTFSECVDLQRGEFLWMPMPFFHTGGIGPMTAIMSRGAGFVTQPHFEPDGIVPLIEKYRVGHWYSGFPQFSLTVLQCPAYSPERFGFIRSMLNVGPPGMQRGIQALLPEGAVLLNLFGMTEGSGIVTFTPWDASLDIRATTSGKPPGHTEVRIVDPETGRLCPVEVAGEIQFRGGGALAYYYRDPQATAQTILEGGWVRTGDRGKLDAQGWLYYLGRLKDMLKVGGENVAAAEIEFFLSQHPQVKLAQVIAAPDERMGEVPVAFIERAPGATVTEEALLEMCAGQLARWKIPRAVVFVTEWPMSATKVQKFRLRELLPERFRQAI